MSPKNTGTGAGNKVSIAVMGLTGSGKSTFINLVSGSYLPVSNGLNSCTQQICFGLPLRVDNHDIDLIDTPGFDDTNRNDAEILKTITDYLKEQYDAGRVLHGIIYLHRITDNRMGGAARRSFTTLKKLCGEDILKNIVIVTNMWNLVNPEDGVARENELKTSPTFFKGALDRGARLHRHDHTTTSAEAVIRYIAKNHPKALSVQLEMVTEEKALPDTAVGIQVKNDLQGDIVNLRKEVERLHKERAEDEATINGLKAEVEAARASIAQVNRQMLILLGIDKTWRGMAVAERVAMMFRLAVEGDTGRTTFWSLLGPEAKEIRVQLRKEFSKRPIPFEVHGQLLRPCPEEEHSHLYPDAKEPSPEFQLWIDQNPTAVENLEKVVKKCFPAKKKTIWEWIRRS